MDNPELFQYHQNLFMEQYKNLQGNSGVQAFEIGGDFIKVQFIDKMYLYTYESAGQLHVEHMKSLALKGEGLSTYISRYIRKNYEAKY